MIYTLTFDKKQIGTLNKLAKELKASFAHDSYRIDRQYFRNLKLVTPCRTILLGGYFVSVDFYTDAAIVLAKMKYGEIALQSALIGDDHDQATPA